MIITAGNFNRISERAALPRPTIQRPRPAMTPHGFEDPLGSLFNDYMPLKDNIDLFRVVREQIPFMDSAILILVRLIGDFRVETYGKESLKTKIDTFIENVKVNWYDQGLWSFKEELSDSAFEAGMGFGELVPLASMTGVHRLKTCNPGHFCWLKKDGRVVLATYKNSTLPEEVEDDRFVYYLAWDKRQGHPQGKSLLYSCVTFSQAYVRWVKSFENNVWRFGDPSLAAELSMSKDTMQADYEYYRNSISSQFQQLWQNRKVGKVGDLVGGIPDGSVTFKTLGADAPLQEYDFSVRNVLEGLVSKTGLPPEFLGLSWSSTERMSQYKADKLQATIQQQRRRLTPILKRIIDMYLVLSGSAGERWDLVWNDVLLLDETEQARAKFQNAYANEKIIANTANMISMGWMDQEAGEEALRSQGVIKNPLPKDWVMRTKSKMFLKEMVRENL